MITQSELVEILQKHSFNEEQIERLTSKKTLLDRGNRDKIDSILNVLKELEIGLEYISKSSRLLIDGKANEIKKIIQMLEIYGIHKETIEDCLYVLAQGKAEEIEKILKVLESHGIHTETIEDCLYVLAQGKADEIEEKLIILNKYSIPQKIIKENYGKIFCLNMDDFKEIFEKNSQKIKNNFEIKQIEKTIQKKKEDGKKVEEQEER